MRRVLPILAVLTMSAISTAQPTYRTPPPAPRPVWDSTGWVLLGERTVNGRYDHDTISVGRYEGRFQKLTLVVERDDMELLDFKITFADRSTYDPRVNHYFREGTRTRVIDLPPGESLIQSIDLRYRNVGGPGQARIAVFGQKAAPAFRWDPTGWTILGERTVNGRYDRDTISVGRYEGRFQKLTLVVERDDLELLDFKITFADRSVYDPHLNHYFREGTRTRAIDLPPGESIIERIDMRYRNVGGPGQARIAVWGMKEPPRPPPGPGWDSRGWTMLGETYVNGHGREDNDRIQVGRAEGKFERLMLVVLDADLEMIDFNIVFMRGEDYHPGVNTYFRGGTRTRSIDLPGEHRRSIRQIDFKYRNIPGGGKARVQVWAK